MIELSGLVPTKSPSSKRPFMEPSVKIWYSESDHPKLQPGSLMSLGAANSFFEYRDVICEDANTIENVLYEVSYMVNGEVRTHVTSQNLGDGEGSVINHLRISTIDALKAFGNISPNSQSAPSKNPFSIMRTSCHNMLQVILPQLEAYCLAYKVFDLVDSFGLSELDTFVQGGISSIMCLIQNEPDKFVGLLDDICKNNPDDTSLVSAVETLLYKMERYVELTSHPEGQSEDFVEVLQRATQKAIIINEHSILNQEPPPVKGEACYEPTWD